MTKYIESQIDDARRMRAAGALWKEVEAKTGVGRDVIHYHDKKKLKPGHNKITDAEIVQAAERVSQGEHLKAVAASYWVSHQLLAYQIKKMNAAEIQHERVN